MAVRTLLFHVFVKKKKIYSYFKKKFLSSFFFFTKELIGSKNKTSCNNLKTSQTDLLFKMCVYLRMENTKKY